MKESKYRSANQPVGSAKRPGAMARDLQPIGTGVQPSEASLAAGLTRSRTKRAAAQRDEVLSTERPEAPHQGLADAAAQGYASQMNRADPQSQALGALKQKQRNSMA